MLDESMMPSDPIVDEIRRIRDERAAKFNYDPEAMFQDLREWQRTSGLTFVNFAAPRTEPKVEVAPSQLPQATDTNPLPQTGG